MYDVWLLVIRMIVNDSACDLISSESVRVSVERGDCRSALKSPVIITFLYVASNGDRILKKCVGDAALSHLYTAAMRMI